MTGPTQQFWQERFACGTIPWDRGAPNPQLLQWIDDGTLRPGERLIVPGCGQGWEVAALAAAGMETIGIDYSSNALALCRQLLERSRVTATLVEADVLHWQPDTPVDAVFEQTCLCALHPDHWTRYAAQLYAWLKPGGRLLALFMQVAARPDAPPGAIEGPPYHCDIHALRAIFPASRWDWPKPPYPALTSPVGQRELVVVLTRKPDRDE